MVVEQFAGDHGTQTADVTNTLVGLGNGSQALANHFTQTQTAGQQLLFLEHLHHRQGCCAGQRTTGIGAAQSTGRQCVHDLGTATHASDRETTGNRLGKSGQVRRHAHLFHGKEGAGTAGAGLYFVGHQQNTVLITQGAQTLHKGRAGDIKAALTLDRFNNYCGDVTRLGIVLEHPLDTGDGVIFADAMQRAGELGAEHATGHQTHARRVGRDLAGHRQGHHGAAVIATGEGNYTGTTGRCPGNLHGVFQSLGAGRDQQGFLGKVAGHPGVDFLAQFDVGLIGQHLKTGMGIQIQLALDRINHLGVSMTGIEHRDATGKVDKLSAFHIPDAGIFRALDKNRMNLADTPGHGILPALHQTFIGLAHI